MRLSVVSALTILFVSHFAVAQISLTEISVADADGNPLEGVVLTSESGAFDGVSEPDGVIYRRPKAKKHSRNRSAASKAAAAHQTATPSEPTEPTN